MKITSVETFIAGLDRRNYLFVRVQTDEGIHGIGEAYSCGLDDATAAVADFETWLVGKDPRDVGKRRDLLVEPLTVTDGYIGVPDAPGFGIELNLDAFEKYPMARWHRPFHSNVDGSLAYQ